MGDFIYELFITDHPQNGLSGCDLLSLYYGRGGFEKLLGDEDREQDCDRWCSWHPQGQEFWQILSQWVWNWRLWAGNAHQPQPLRQTIWSPAQPERFTPSESEATKDEPLKLSENSSTDNVSGVDAAEYGPMQVSGGWARSRNKFSGDDFTLVDERTLICPAKNPMYRREVRYNRYGDKLILFGINPRTCQQCSLKSQCLADGSKGTGGRRITVKSKKLSSPSTEPQAQATLKPKPVVQSPLVKDNSSKNQPSRPVLWLDFPTTRLRRDLSHQLRQQQLVIESISATNPITKQPNQLITRDQRAHRRLSWTQRWSRNSILDTAAHWRVTLCGISSAILDWLGSLKPSPALII